MDRYTGEMSPPGYVGPDAPPNSESVALKPCPFCGREPYVVEPAYRGADYQIGCYCGHEEDAVEVGAVWRDGKTFDEARDRWNRRAPLADQRLALEGHQCETILDLSRHMLDGSEVEGHSRIWKLGRLIEPIEGAPAERWCWHIRTAWKPEIVFGFNEADMTYLVVTAFAALGYHVNPEWAEAIAGRKPEAST